MWRAGVDQLPLVEKNVGSAHKEKHPSSHAPASLKKREGRDGNAQNLKVDRK